MNDRFADFYGAHVPLPGQAPLGYDVVVTPTDEQRSWVLEDYKSILQKAVKDVNNTLWQNDTDPALVDPASTKNTPYNSWKFGFAASEEP